VIEVELKLEKDQVTQIILHKSEVDVILFQK
jgi:hypothetical protein